MNHIKELAVIYKEASHEVKVAKDRASEARYAFQSEKPEFILPELEHFLQDMEDPEKRNSYISSTGSPIYSCNFTKFVNRTSTPVSNKHLNAITDYLIALERLNKIFVEELEKLSFERLEYLSKAWGVKLSKLT